MTIEIKCDCRVCNGLRAQVHPSSRITPTRVHNLVQMAHSPLARALVNTGPWPLPANK